MTTNNGNDTRLQQDLERNEAWLREAMSRHPAPDAGDLSGLKERMRGELRAMDGTLDRIKLAVHEELAGPAAGRSSVQRPAALRIRRFVLATGGLAAAAALALFVGLGEPAARTGNRPVASAAIASRERDLSALEDFVQVIAGGEAGSQETAAREMASGRNGTVGDDPDLLSTDAVFDGEVDAVDQDLDRLQSERWMASSI